MTIMTKVFGEITIDDDRIIKFPKGIVGFPDLTDFALLHDSEKGTDSIHWLQSLQEPAFAMPACAARICGIARFMKQTFPVPTLRMPV